MDTRTSFDEGIHLDLTIKLEHGIEIKVHKAIVCRANEYFGKLCGPDSHFALGTFIPGIAERYMLTHITRRVGRARLN
jgi:hypothetical protein